MTAAPTRPTTSRRIAPRFDRTRLGARTLGALALLTAALPANLAVTAVALARLLVTPDGRRVAPHPQTVLISGGKMTKALALCRAFHAAGHRVVLVEAAKYRLTGHRFSRAVDAFHTVPVPTDPGYAQALLAIVQAEDVDLYVPVCSPVSSWYDAQAVEVLTPYCEVLHGDADTVAMLDDKYRFARQAAELGLAVPDTNLITSPVDVEQFPFADRAAPYVLKNIAYDPVNRLDLTLLPMGTATETQRFAHSKPVTGDAPWILQSFVRGQEFCTHSTVRDGRVLVYACCESSAFQVNYEFADRPDIEAWVRHFVGALGLTGQVSLDFIVDASGEARAIECNPRTHSAITMFYDHPDLAAAYLDELPADVTLVPTARSRATYWLYHELWRMLADPRRARERWQVIRTGKDAIFAWDDPLPNLLVHHLQIPALLLHNLVRGRDWTRIDFNIGKLVEPGGD